MSRKAKDRTALEERIGYKFADKAMLERALTHISALAGGHQNRASSYQRLEFLGDHVLGLVISDMLYRAFPKANEGELSRRLADLVRKETCAEVAKAMDLGPALKLGNSESHAGGRLRSTILADVCEALIGAVFLDGGFDAAREFILREFGAGLGRLDALPVLENPKGELQELLQATSNEAPQYRVVSTSGPDHDRVFECTVHQDGVELARGTGRSKKAAESEAALAALKKLREVG